MYWRWKRENAREVASNVMETLPSSDFVTLKMSRGQLALLQWEGEKEFSFQGKMYDVLHSFSQSDSVSFSCYQDDHESWVVHEMKQLLKACFGDSENGKEEHDCALHFELFCQVSMYFYPQVNLSQVCTLASPYHFFYTSPAFPPSFRPPCQA